MTNQSNQALLSTVLRSESKAVELLNRFKFEDIASAGQNALGLTDAAFKRLQVGIELGRRVQELATTYKVNRISSTKDAVAYCARQFSRLASDSKQEEFWIVTLDTKNNPIDTHQITVGTLDAALVHPREVFRPAIKDAASSVLLVHNHPSGDTSPSREDIQVTDRLTECGKLIGIDVLDHIVVGLDGGTSIREN